MAIAEHRATDSPHHFLRQLAGGWSGIARTWQDPTAEPSTGRVQGSIQVILDGRFILYLYESSVQGEPQHGMFTFGYDTTTDQYQASWVDSFHNNTAIMYCVGNAREHGFFVQGNYPDLAGGPDWGLRTEVELPDPDHLKITAYNISPEGMESLATQTELTRVRQ